jgi:hypothetical protein
MVTKIHWENSDRASQCLVVPLLDETMGVQDPEVREATRKWMLRMIESEEADDLRLNMGDLCSRGWDFATGYEQALVDMGKREPDGKETFKD